MAGRARQDGRADRGRAPANAAHPPGSLQEAAIGADGDHRDAEAVGEVGDPDEAARLDLVGDPVLAQLRGHAMAVRHGMGLGHGIDDRHSSTQPPCGDLLKHSKQAVTDPLSKGYESAYDSDCMLFGEQSGSKGIILASDAAPNFR